LRYVKIAVPDTFDPETHQVYLHTPAWINEAADEPVWDVTPVEVWKPIYQNLLDKGHIGLIDFMGDDQTVVNAARVSYGSGTKRVQEDRNLLRYLMRHRHWTPFEMVELMWHVKAPIFVFRQWHRHRAASINEYSARYSILSDEMYMPDEAVMKPQSPTNKQGRGGSLNDNNIYACQLQLQHIFQECMQAYRYLLGEANLPSTSLNRRYELVKEFALERVKALQETDPDWAPELVTDAMIDLKVAEVVQANGLSFTDAEFWGEGGLGLSRELARICMPLATYSEMYWKADLRNTFNFVSLRSDPHAQEEIRVYSNAMLEMMEPIAPVCVAAFIDYNLKGQSMSQMEMKVIQHLYRTTNLSAQCIEDIMKEEGASKREITELLAKLEV
jgi:thymidylate synthase (FAD)